jgi:hypothetical protein
MIVKDGVKMTAIEGSHRIATKKAIWKKARTRKTADVVND